MTRTIDCRNLECPKPVIMTKNALEGLNEGESLKMLDMDQKEVTGELKDKYIFKRVK